MLLTLCQGFIRIVRCYNLFLSSHIDEANLQRLHLETLIACPKTTVFGQLIILSLRVTGIVRQLPFPS